LCDLNHIFAAAARLSLKTTPAKLCLKTHAYNLVAGTDGLYA